MSTPPLASGPEGPDALRPLLETVLDALREGTAARGGPLPAGGPQAVARRVRDTVGDVLPRQGTQDALHVLVRALAEGAADPADPLCAAHLHCPPLAVATAADLAAAALNPSLDSWDQAPAASELETLVTQALAHEVYGTQGDALVTTGGTESNQLALLLAREAHSALQLVCGANAHHSLHRAAWLLGLPDPVVVPAPRRTMDPAALDEALTELPGPRGNFLVAATAGTTDAGLIDPLPDIADLCAAHGARLHIDAAYGEASSSATATAPNSTDSTAPTPSPSTCTNSAGSPSPQDSSPYATPTTSPYCNTAPTTSTPTTTPKQDSPTSSAAPCAPPDAPTSSKSPSPSKPSAGKASAPSSTKSAPTPASWPTS